MTPEDELELRGQQSSLLQALSQQKSPYENTLEMSLAAALPALGTALAGGGSMGALGYGAVAGARGVESYGELMKAQQEKDRTASLLELSNIQNRLDAASMYRSEQAKNQASLERAKATTGLGQLLEAGGTPEDFLRLQEQKASLMQAQAQRALRPTAGEGFIDQTELEGLANLAEQTGNTQAAAELRSPGAKVTRTEADRARAMFATATNQKQREQNISLREEEEARRKAEEAGFPGAIPMYQVPGANKDEPSFRPTKKLAENAIKARAAYGRLNNSMAKFESLLEKSGGNLPNIIDKYSAEFLQLREDIISQVRVLEGMGANFTAMERNSVVMRMLGLGSSEKDEQKLWNLKTARDEALGAPDPLGAIKRFRQVMTNNYARSTLNNRFIDPTIRYDDKLIEEEYKHLPVPIINTILIQQNPEMQAKADELALAQLQTRTKAKNAANNPLAQ
jgi:hypothetical protein